MQHRVAFEQVGGAEERTDTGDDDENQVRQLRTAKPKSRIGRRDLA